MSQALLERLRDYLNKKFRDELGSAEFKIKTKDIVCFDESKKELVRGRWEIEAEVFTSCRYICEYENGRVRVESLCFDAPGDAISEVLVKLYQRELKMKGEGEVSAEKNRKEKEIHDDFINRRNIEKHVRKPYGRVFTRLLWADKIAEEVSRKFGIEVKILIDDTSHDWRTFFTSSFDSSGMDEERKYEEIKRRVEAVSTARKLYDKSFKKEYKEFHREILAKVKGKSKHSD